MFSEITNTPQKAKTFNNIYEESKKEHYARSATQKKLLSSDLKRFFTSPEPKKQRNTVFSHFSNRYRVRLSEEEICCTRISQDGSIAAVSFSDGELKIISTLNGEVLHHIKDEELPYPVYSMCWKPVAEVDSQVAQKLIGVCADGRVISWTVHTGNKLEHDFLSLDPKQAYQAVGYSLDGYRFVAAGDNPSLEVFDSMTNQIIHSFDKYKHPMHKNKVFVAKFSPLAVNLIYSGGWDRQIKFWDVRTDSCIAQISQVQICGDSVDMSSNNLQLVTGGGSMGEGLAMWDMRKLQKPTTLLNWDGPLSMLQNEEKRYVNPTFNVVKFAPIAGTSGLDSDYILAGCRDSVRSMHVKCIHTRTGNIVNEFSHVNQSCLTLDVSRDGSIACLGDKSGVIHVENVNMAKKDPQ